MDESFERVATNRHKNKNKRVAKEVTTGKLGAGHDLKKAITDAGYDYDEVHERINTMLRKKMNLSIHDIAEEVAEGKWGDDEMCKKLLIEAGYNYNDVMKEVQRLNK